MAASTNECFRLQRILQILGHNASIPESEKISQFANRFDALAIEGTEVFEEAEVFGEEESLAEGITPNNVEAISDDKLAQLLKAAMQGMRLGEVCRYASKAHFPN